MMANEQEITVTIEPRSLARFRESLQRYITQRGIPVENMMSIAAETATARNYERVTLASLWLASWEIHNRAAPTLGTKAAITFQDIRKPHKPDIMGVPCVNQNHERWLMQLLGDKPEALMKKAKMAKGKS